jgi:restriction system protein
LSVESNPETTPEEAIEGAFGEINGKLADDILELIKKTSSQRFEMVIVELMLRLGYGGIENGQGIVLGKSGDEGVDGVINEDKLGLDKIYLQAKRYANQTVGSPQVQAFAGALAGKKANKGVFVTTSQFSSEARRYAESVPSFTIILIDGPRLAQLMIECNLGVAVKHTYLLKRIDSEFFAEIELS